MDTLNETSIAEEKGVAHALFNADSERALLGTLLINNNSWDGLSDLIKENYFYVPIHKCIFTLIKETIEAQMLAAPLSIGPMISGHPDISGDAVAYLNMIAASAPIILDAGRLALYIKDLFLKRQLVELITEAVSMIKTKNCTANDIISSLEDKTFSLVQIDSVSKQALPVSFFLKEVQEKIRIGRKKRSYITGISTGYIDLDKLLGGFHKGDLAILAARPSMGKTALALNIAYHCAINLQKECENNANKMHVAFFSMEMSSDQLVSRLLAMESGINSIKIRTGMINDQELAQVTSAIQRLQNVSLVIDDTPALTVASLRSRARRLVRKHGTQIIFIDYLQMMYGTNKSSESNRVQEISEISRGLKAISKELNIPVVALSQLSRAVEQREDKKPQLADLRESGSIEQDADIVMFIYREEYYFLRKQPTPGTEKHIEWQNSMEEIRYQAEVLVAKQRNGPIGNINLFFDPGTNVFKNMAEDLV